MPIENKNVGKAASVAKEAKVTDDDEDEEEDEMSRMNPRDRAITTIVKRFQDHPFVRKVVSNQLKSNAITHRLKDTLGAYLAEAGMYELLTREDEGELFGYIEDGIATYDALDGNLENLSPEETDTLLHLTAAHQAVYHTNLRLVISIAKKYAAVAPTMTFLDLIQEGNLGLSKSICRFDGEAGTKFSTYATWWIRQTITRSIANDSRTIRLPVHMHEQWVKLSTKTNELTHMLDRQPTSEEIAKYTGKTVAEVNKLRRVGNVYLLSLNSPTGENDDMEFGDSLVDTTSAGMDGDIELLSNKEELKNILAQSSLDDRSKIILGLRNGIEPEIMGDLSVDVYVNNNLLTLGYEEAARSMPTTKGLTLQDVSNLLGVTRERVRQIESKAIDYLRVGGSPDIDASDLEYGVFA